MYGHLLICGAESKGLLAAFEHERRARNDRNRSEGGWHYSGAKPQRGGAGRSRSKVKSHRDPAGGRRCLSHHSNLPKEKPAVKARQLCNIETIVARHDLLGDSLSLAYGSSICHLVSEY